MLTKIAIIGAGFLLSKLPYKVLEVVTHVLARIYLAIPQKRKRLLFSNLTHAFPDWASHKIRKTAIQSTVQLIEMGFFSLIYPHLSSAQRRSTLIYSNKSEHELTRLKNENKPTLILLPHITLFESVATSPVFRPSFGKKLGAVYRPNSNPIIDNWINKARTDLGLSVFSRKKGLIQARKHLREGNWLILLFDQNAGLGGDLSLFMDRLCSISPLPDIVLKGLDANIVLVTPLRKSFFCAELKFSSIHNSEYENVSKWAHNKLENILNIHEEGLPEWLWSHGKWKTQDNAQQIFNIYLKRNSLPITSEIPRKTKFWIRMPNWLGDVVMALPLIKAIERGRPDAEITLLCQSQFKPLLQHLSVGHEIIELPAKGSRYFLEIWSLRTRYPDVHFLFTNSLRGDIESRLIGSPLRLGGSMGSKRKLLTHQATISKDFENKHQVELWTEYLKYFGLKRAIDYSPLLKVYNLNANPKVICLAPGSSNSPEKRWPIENWIHLLRYLAGNLVDYKFKLIGTSKDSRICQTIASSLPSENLFNHSGGTNLVQLCEIFQESSAIICNDSGAMHLANSLGLPVVAIFGPTSPSITGPVYDAITSIQCDDGNSMKKIVPKSVANEVYRLLCEGIL